MDRRSFIASASIPLLIPDAYGAWPETQPERALFPCPKDGARVGVNPPGFAWWRVAGAGSYRLIIRNAAGKEVYSVEGLDAPVHLPERTLAPGEYAWDVEGSGGFRRGEHRFTVPEGIPELRWEEPKKLLARVPDFHPRYIFLADELQAIRASLKTTRREAWGEVRARADRALRLPLPEPPQYHTLPTRVERRMGYFEYFRKLRGVLDQGMSILALAYLMSGDERYGLAAKRILLEVERWSVGGPMSVLSEFGDEPGLSMARHGHRVYDWLYDLFDSDERKRVRRMTIERARQVMERLEERDYLAYPAESHNGRMIAYLSEYAVVLKGESDEAHRWLDYSLRALTTFYPHWAGSDGGWAEGIGYALAYNTIYLPAIESLRSATGFDLYKRPFYRRVRKFFFYCASPVGEIRPFGDGAERAGVGSAGAALMAHHGRRFRDPAAVWWARQTGESTTGSDPMVSLITEDNVRPEIAANTPQAAVFRGVGWAGLHSSVENPQQDTFFLFKSSPYGSVSHSHADQNSFAILKGGTALAIPSGYYGPAYGMPHHAEWTRQTKANNSILVNGEGQVVRSAAAQGSIIDFRHQAAITYVAGDATAAYGGKLQRFVRHVLFLRPGVFLVVDQLEAPRPAHFQWLLHAFDKMETGRERTESTRRGASLTVRLACKQDLDFSQTDRFDTPFNHGNPPAHRRKVAAHWHFTASTKQQSRRSVISAVMLVTGPGEQIEANWGPNRIEIETVNGKGEAWVDGGWDVRLHARWRPKQGEPEQLSAGSSRA